MPPEHALRNTLHNYKKNGYPELPTEMRREISKEWERFQELLTNR
jgi:hypothetical protein